MRAETRPRTGLTYPHGTQPLPLPLLAPASPGAGGKGDGVRRLLQEFLCVLGNHGAQFLCLWKRWGGGWGGCISQGNTRVRPVGLEKRVCTYIGVQGGLEFLQGGGQGLLRLALLARAWMGCMGMKMVAGESDTSEKES